MVIRISIILGLFFWQIHCLMAQADFLLGIRSGATLTTFSAKEAFKPFYQPVLRPSFQIDAIYGIHKYMSIESGIGYFHAAQKRLNFTNEFLGLQVPVAITYDLIPKNEKRKTFPFLTAGGELVYILGTIHIEDGERRSIDRWVNPWQGNFMLGGGLKHNYKNHEQLLFGVHAKIGYSGFPAGKQQPFLPQLIPFQIGLNLGWRMNFSEKSKKEEKEP